MTETTSIPSVLIAADPGRVDELAAVFEEPLAQGYVEILRSTGGDDTIDYAEQRRPHVVVVTATLESGDSGALIDALSPEQIDQLTAIAQAVVAAAAPDPAAG